MLFNPDHIKTNNVIIIKGRGGCGKTTLAKHLIQKKNYDIQHLGNLDYGNMKLIKKRVLAIKNKGGIFMQMKFNKGIGIIIDELINSIKKNILKELLKISKYATDKIMVIYIISDLNISGIKRVIKKHTLINMNGPSEIQIKHIINEKESNKINQNILFKKLKNIKDFRLLYAELNKNLTIGYGKRDIKFYRDDINKFALDNLKNKDDKFISIYSLLTLSLYLNNSYKLLPNSEQRYNMANIISDSIVSNNNYCTAMSVPFLFNKKKIPKKLIKPNLLSYQCKFKLNS